MTNQISFFVENYGTGVRFNKSTGESITIAYIKVEKGEVYLKQNEHFPALNISEVAAIHKRMKKVAAE